MKILKQFGIILLITFLGEGLKSLLPLPIPASIYGMVIMLVLLTSGKLKLESVRDTAIFLIEVMPLMFIPAAVGLINSWGTIQSRILPYAAVTLVSLLVVMLMSGWATQFVIRRGHKERQVR